MHAGMIRARWQATRGRRGVAIGVGAALMLGAVLAARPADPAAADPPREAQRQDHLAARARDAAAALDAFAAALAPGRDAARRGAALIQAGDMDPAPTLEEAAMRLESVEEVARTAGFAIEELRGVAASARAGVFVPPVAAPVELRGIAGQLRQAGEAAGTFVERRRAAQRTLLSLEEALAALEADDPDGALAALERARVSRAVLAAWDPSPLTLPLWLETTDRLITAADGIAEAVLAGDAAGAELAAREYAAAADDARRADVSLALTLSEAGASLTSVPLQRLGAVLAGIEQARAVVASLVQDGP
jgi:hypothetical protein